MRRLGLPLLYVLSVVVAIGIGLSRVGAEGGNSGGDLSCDYFVFTLQCSDVIGNKDLFGGEEVELQPDCAGSYDYHMMAPSAGWGDATHEGAGPPINVCDSPEDVCWVSREHNFGNWDCAKE